MTWLETPSETFVARHDARDGDDAEQVLRSLEAARRRLERVLEVEIGPLDVVLHGSRAQLLAAEPLLAVQRRMTAPAGRRYLAGWAGERELHVLAPRLLARRASNVEGSLELLMLTPVALLAKRAVAAANPGLPPPFGPRAFRTYLRWAWLAEGAAQYLSGQVRHLRPAIARRLREGGAPSFPPSRADAPLLGGTIFDLLDREEGERACADLARADLAQGPRAVLEAAFHGRPLRHTETAWRTHLDRLASTSAEPPARRRRRSPRR